jgi:hypothetical protein
VSAFIPTLPQLSREVITVIVGAIVAAAIVSQIPSLKQWLKDQIGSTGSIPDNVF